MLLSVDDFSLHFLINVGHVGRGQARACICTYMSRHMTVSSQRKMSTLDDLFGACKAGDIVAVRRAIANGVDPKKYYGWLTFGSSVYEDSVTPLHVACW